MKKMLLLGFMSAMFFGICGFNLDNAIVPKDEIVSGGPPKDGIPAIMDPKFVSAESIEYLEPDEQVISLEIGGEVKAYPINILTWHEIVNDEVGGEPVAVTFWPLTQTGIVFSRSTEDDTHTFGVSGLLYKSNLVMYDHQTETLWSQLKETAIAGPMVGTELETIPSERLDWENFRKRHPSAPVLSRDTGYERDYTVNPYEGYSRVFGLWFPVGDVRKELPPKDRVMGISIDGNAKAYPIAALQQTSGILTDTVGGEVVRIEVSEEGQVSGVEDQAGNPVNPVFSYWFSWQAFHPDTAVYGK